MKLSKLAFVCLLGSIVFVDAGHAASKSEKKQRADSINIKEPQVLEKEDVLAGVRIAVGNVVDAGMGFGLNGEYMITHNIGLGGQFFYASHDADFSAGGLSGSWSYTSLLFLAYGALHADVFNVKNLDTFASLGLGYHSVSASWSSSSGLAEPVGVSTGGVFLSAYLTARFFLDSQWGVSGSIGTGTGTLLLGVDYIF